MSKHALMLASLLSLALVLPSAGFAADQEVTEATVFFNEVIQHTDNPLIANLAKISLTKLKSGGSLSNTEAPITPVASSFSPLTAVAAPARKIADGIEIPLIKGNFSRNLVVPALLNRETTGTFIVDTGATYSVITSKLAKELGLSVGGDSQRIPILTANGWIQAPLVKISHMSLGNVEVKNVQAVVQDLGGDPNLSGLLGMNFFSNIELTIRRDKLILRIGNAD